MKQGISISLIISLSCILVSIYGCNNHGNWEHTKTYRLADKVFVERFYKSYGAVGGSVEKYYVTDSSTYHSLIATCDEKEFIKVDLNGSQLLVEKRSRRNLKDDKWKTIETKSYDLSSL